MTFKTMLHVIDAWYSGVKYKLSSNRFPPSLTIRVDTEPAFDVTNHTVIMRYNGKVIKKDITDKTIYHMTETAFVDLLNELWDEINKSFSTSVSTSVRVPAKDYDIYDSAWPVAKYIDYHSMATANAFDYWCMDYLIKRVIFSDPCTIVLWKDGTKTIVRCTDEKFDKEKGLAMCIAKKSLGNKGKYYDVFKKWIKEEEK